MLFSAGERGVVAATGVCANVSAVRLNNTSANKYFMAILDFDLRFRLESMAAAR
jgi:hypothetical protein